MTVSSEGRSAERKRFERVAKTVALLAHRVHRKFPELSVEDLVSIGNEAAVEASRTFDDSRDIPFEIFAFKRIRGAMLRASVREVFDPVSSAVKRAIHLQMDFDMTPPAQVDLETALEDTPEKIRARAVKWLREQATAMLSAAIVANQEKRDTPQGEEGVTTREAYARGHAKLTQLLAKLPKEEGALFDALYRKENTLDEAAARLKTPKRTLQRLHQKMKERLAVQLRGQGITEEPPLAGRLD